MKNTYTIDDKITVQLSGGGLGVDPWAVKDSLSHTLIPSSLVAWYYNFKYGDFYCSDMYFKFSDYNTMHADDLAKALTAWNAEYNPIENYNGKETRINLENNGADTTERTTDPLHNTVTTAAIDGTKTETYTTTDTSTTARLEGYETSDGGTVSTDDLHTKTETTRDTTTLDVDGTTYTAHDVRGEIFTRAGNMGTTTTQQMINEEITMRMNSPIKNYLDTFIYQYASYVGGAWNVF